MLHPSATGGHDIHERIRQLGASNVGAAVGEVLVLHGCIESYAGQVRRQLVKLVRRQLVKLVGACCWSSIGHGSGSHICARQLSMAH